MNPEITNEFRITDPEPLEAIELCDCIGIDALSEELKQAYLAD